jgi:hypothetical protein
MQRVRMSTGRRGEFRSGLGLSAHQIRNPEFCSDSERPREEDL